MQVPKGASISFRQDKSRRYGMGGDIHQSMGSKGLPSDFVVECKMPKVPRKGMTVALVT